MPSHTDLHSRIETNILDGALTEAASILQSFNSNLTDNTLRGKLSSDIEKASDTYGRLLDFFVKGFPDEGRRDMVSDISQKLLSVNDAILRGIQKTDSSDPYYSALRFNETTSVSLENLIGKYKSGIEKISLVPEGEVPPLQLREETEKTATDIFHYIWTMHFADISDYAIVSSVLSDDSIPFSLKAQVVSALMLGNLRFFDQQGLEILIDAASQYDDERLAARAMTATVAVMKRHPRRIRSNRNIRLRIDAWADDIMIYRRLREVMLNMLRSRDTARIESSLKNDIIPGLQKIRPDIIGKMRKAAS